MEPPSYVVRVTGKNHDGNVFNGTGFVVGSGGLVATCWHVVKDAAEIRVQLPYTEPWKYKVRDKLEKEDLALLEGIVPPAASMPHATLHSEWKAETRIGDSVMVWGCSAAKYYNAPQQFKCIVSGFSGEHGRVGVNGDINPGDSGAPVFCASGKVIGMVQVRDPERSGQGMVIPISLLLELLGKQIAAHHPLESLQPSCSVVPDEELAVQAPLAVWSINDVESRGLNLQDMLRRWLAIDYATIQNLSERHEGREEQWIHIVKGYPDCWRLLVNTENSEPVGYWHFVPLFEEHYRTASEGRLYGVDVTPDKIEFVCLPGVYRIYFIGFSILPRFKTYRTFRMLMCALLGQFQLLAENEIFFAEVCANAFTEEGLSLCETLKMERICEHEERGTIYTMRLLPLPNLPILKAFPKLKRLYAKRALRPK
jgi:hypothetical protein